MRGTLILIRQYPAKTITSNRWPVKDKNPLHPVTNKSLQNEEQLNSESAIRDNLIIRNTDLIICHPFPVDSHLSSQANKNKEDIKPINDLRVDVQHNF